MATRLARAPSPSGLSVNRAERRALRGKSGAMATSILIATLAAYAATLIAALSASSLLIAIPSSLLCGLAIGLLFIVGHDACHQAFTGSAFANKLVGRVAFLPSLHPYGLWDLGHNRTHHRYNNVRGKDYVWEPMSPEDYRAAGPRHRFAYRFYHSVPGLFLYYGVEIWAKRMFFVNPRRLPDPRPAYGWDLLMVWAFVPLQAWAIIVVGHLFGKPPGTALLLGLLVPFLVWNGLMSFVIYLHHIHPKLPWYDSVESWRAGNGKIAGTAHVRFPVLVDKLLLHIMKHGAHHHAPGVPLYNLTGLQRMIDSQASPSWRWSPKEFLRICRECKLFDYQAGAWRRFEADDRRETTS
jgi:omega-6 fatty acid desaturase (delta-12 desaturase)